MLSLPILSTCFIRRGLTEFNALSISNKNNEGNHKN